jgi:hypothetical protein
MASQGDLNLYQGDDYDGTVLVQHEDGTPADISGYTARSQIRRAIADEDPEVAVEITTTVVSPEVFLHIPHDITATLSGAYVWDLQLTTPSGTIITVAKGKVKLTYEVTRATA